MKMQKQKSNKAISKNSMQNKNLRKKIKNLKILKKSYRKKKI